MPDGIGHSVEGYDAIGQTTLGYGAGHTPHNACRLVLGEDRASGLFDGLATIGTVGAHAGQDHGQGSTAEVLGR